MAFLQRFLNFIMAFMRDHFYRHISDLIDRLICVPFNEILTRKRICLGSAVDGNWHLIDRYFLLIKEYSRTENYIIVKETLPFLRLMTLFSPTMRRYSRICQNMRSVFYFAKTKFLEKIRVISACEKETPRILVGRSR